jgi:DNA-binding transcriptional LysR family regulator
MRRSLPDVALRVHVDVPQDLINQVATGLVDAAIMYAPQHRPGLKVDLLMEEKLVLVTARPDGALSDDSAYIHVDWGPEFTLRHSLDSEETPALSFDFGPLALDYIIAAGRSGYFRMSAVEPHVTSGRLQLVRDAPQSSYPIYVVYTGNADDSVLGAALSGLHAIIDGNAD